MIKNTDLNNLIEKTTHYKLAKIRKLNSKAQIKQPKKLPFKAVAISISDKDFEDIDKDFVKIEKDFFFLIKSILKKNG